MNCGEATLLIGAYADAELDAARSVEVEGHAAACANCARELEEIRMLRAALREPGLYFTAPSRLRAGLAAKPKPIRRVMTFVLLAAAVVAMIVTAGIFAVRERNEATVVAELEAGHVRSLMAEHLLDVKSSDQHTVKPWFTGKLDFSPEVVDFAGDGFPLAGGRLEYVGGRAVAALVYMRNRHVVNVYEWPGTGPDWETSHDGFNFIAWSTGGMTYRAVSDLNRAELSALVRLMSRR